MTFEVIWICYDRVWNNLFRPYKIWKTKTQWIKCNSPHSMKVNSLFTGRIGRPEGRKFFGSQPTHNEKKWWLLRFFKNVVGNPLGSMHKKSLITGRSGKFRNLRSNTKVIFLWRSIFSHNQMVANQSIISQQIKRNLQNISRKFNVPWIKYHVTFGINAVCIFMYRLQERQLPFSEICRQDRHFENGYHKITISIENRAVTSVQLARKRNQ